MANHNIALLTLLCVTIVVRWLYGRTYAWWCWQDPANVVLGLVYCRLKGAPRCPQAPMGLRSASSITLGIGLFMVRVHWFGRVPKKWDHP